MQHLHTPAEPSARAPPAWPALLALHSPREPQAGLGRALQSADVPPLPGAGLNGMNSSIWEHFASGSFSPGTSPAFLSGPGAAELARLRQELDEANGTIKQWEESWKQAKQVLGPHGPPSPCSGGVPFEPILHSGHGLGRPGVPERTELKVSFVLSTCGKTCLGSQDAGVTGVPDLELPLWSGPTAPFASPQKP